MPTATDVREQVVELAREFAKEKIEPFAAEWDRTKHFARDVIDELGKLGFLGMCTPEEFDGMALDTVTYLMVLEEISAADAAIAVSVGIHNAIPRRCSLKHGTGAEGTVAQAHGSGECSRALRCRRRRRSDTRRSARRRRRMGDWALNGTRAWATNAGTADLMMIWYRSAKRRAARRALTFIVPTDTGLPRREARGQDGPRASIPRRSS
jgi:alkylation response protein AidB-like acyl-CoA dehydrogenase